MYTYEVYEKSTNTLVFRYNAESPIEWGTYPFSLYDHVATPYVDPSAPPPPPPPHVRLTKLEFLRRFTMSERVAMRSSATNNPQLEDYMHLLELAEEVFLDDPDTVAGINALEALGILAPGRVTEILNV